MCKPNKKTVMKMTLSFLFLAVCSLAVTAGSAFWADIDPAFAGQGDALTCNFDDVSPGGLPDGWKAEATGGKGAAPSWTVVEDKSAPSGGHALEMTRPASSSGLFGGFSGGMFNLCWTDSVSFLDGEISVRFRAIRGRIDQGGGIMWRVRDRNNYYVARFNPLEDNFRFYYVMNGSRRMIADAAVRLFSGWHVMKIVQRGDRFQGFIDGKKFLDARDSHFTRAGGAGLWTKADAVTRFDDFRVVPFSGKE
jgi:hypothetical protein